MQLFILLIQICQIVNWIQWFPDIYCFTWLKIAILLIVCQTNNQAGLPSLKNISRQIWHENPSFWDQKKLDIWSNNNFVLLYSMREEVQGSREMVGVEALHMLIKMIKHFCFLLYLRTIKPLKGKLIPILQLLIFRSKINFATFKYIPYL